MECFERRLPVYLVLDCSSSMAGEPIEAVKQGIKALILELKADPQALETAYISVILFDSIARQIFPLMPVIKLKEPSFSAGGVTALGSGLKLLLNCIKQEVLYSSKETKGDFEPLVFLFTDGTPTDFWQDAVKELKKEGISNIIACAAGAQADVTVLKQITDSVLILNTVSSGDLARYFSWVSFSIKQSISINQGF